MKIIKNKTDIRPIQNVREGSFVVHQTNTYIVGKTLKADKKVEVFCLDTNSMEEFDFNVYVIYKPDAYVVLDEEQMI